MELEKLHEECGVFGIWSPEKKNVADLVCFGLHALQHRGQESAGIAVNEDRTIRCHKGTGLVHEVFGSRELAELGQGQIAVGHVRYSTTGGSGLANAQPLLVKHIKGQLAVCHNGNLTNARELRQRLELEGCIFHTTSDTEVISYFMIKNRLEMPSIEAALLRTMEDLQGAYSLVLMSPAKLLACRDPFGIRPLCLGCTEDESYVFASETCALDAVGAQFVRDLSPGEVVMIDQNGVHSFTQHCGKKQPSICVFEYVYFARSDSVIDGISVQAARQKAGEYLAQEHPVEADVVVGVPDSGLDAALGYSRASGIPYGIGLVKNKYIGRTFIEPEQSQREAQLRLKLNAISHTVSGKRVILIDDSIVRGTTTARIVNLIRETGAKEVHIRISSPPFRNPCYYGTDIPSRENLIACKYSLNEIRKQTGADSLGFLSVEHILSLSPDRSCNHYCAACFNGEYRAGEVL